MGGGHGHAEVEGGVALRKARRGEGAGEDDCFPRHPGKRLGGVGHRIGAVSDDNPRFRCLAGMPDNLGAVGIGQLEAVLAADFLDPERQAGAGLHEQLRDRAVDDLVFAQRIEIVLVDRAAGGEDQDCVVGHGRNATPVISSDLAHNAAAKPSSRTCG